MHFFGLWGTLMFFIGFVFFMWIGVDKMFFDTQAKLLSSRTEFYIALTSMILGTLLFLAGFLGELIIKTKSDEKHYTIREKLNL